MSHLSSFITFFCMLFIKICAEQEPIIDVVIPCHEKDLAMLPLVINGIKTNGKNVRRVIVVSAKKLGNFAEWFSEQDYPFCKQDLAHHIFYLHAQAHEFIKSHPSKLCWVFQQLLKLYAPFVIPDIAPNVLVLDADTIFINKTEFIDHGNHALYDARDEYLGPYFLHAWELVPRLEKMFAAYSGIAHHMLFQKNVLQNLFNVVEEHHKKPFWQAFCACINKFSIYCEPCASEYEIYFNFVFQRYAHQARIRKLHWENMRFDHVPIKEIAYYKKLGYHCISCHIPSKQNA